MFISNLVNELSYSSVKGYLYSKMITPQNVVFDALVFVFSSEVMVYCPDIQLILFLSITKNLKFLTSW